MKVILDEKTGLSFDDRVTEALHKDSRNPGDVPASPWSPPYSNYVRDTTLWLNQLRWNVNVVITRVEAKHAAADLSDLVEMRMLGALHDMADKINSFLDDYENTREIRRLTGSELLARARTESSKT